MSGGRSAELGRRALGSTYSASLFCMSAQSAESRAGLEAGRGLLSVHARGAEQSCVHSGQQRGALVQRSHICKCLLTWGADIASEVAYLCHLYVLTVLQTT